MISKPSLQHAHQRFVGLRYKLNCAWGTESAQRDRNERVCVCERGREALYSVGSIFKRACRRSDLTGVTPHTLRHTFASRLVMAGVGLRTVQELVGWQTLGMVERYAHLSPAHKAQAVERIALAPASGAEINTINTVLIAAQ